MNALVAVEHLAERTGHSGEAGVRSLTLGAVTEVGCLMPPRPGGAQARHPRPRPCLSPGPLATVLLAVPSTWLHLCPGQRQVHQRLRLTVECVWVCFHSLIFPAGSVRTIHLRTGWSPPTSEHRLDRVRLSLAHRAAEKGALSSAFSCGQALPSGLFFY